MKQLLTLLTIVPLVLGVLISPNSHAGEVPGEEVFPAFNSRAVVQGAQRTWMNYVEWWNKTRGTPLRGDLELGTNLWAEGIASLKPQYVYTHGVNIVIVRSRHGEDEEGFYVALSIASSPGPNDQGFTRMLIAQHSAGSVFTFQRRGHFERTQTDKGKETTPNKATGANAGGRSQLAMRTRQPR